MLERYTSQPMSPNAKADGVWIWIGVGWPQQNVYVANAEHCLYTQTPHANPGSLHGQATATAPIGFQDYEVPNMSSMDERSGNERWHPPQEGVRESAPLLDAGVRHRVKPDWPFLYYEERGTTYLNRAVRTTKYTDATTTGLALF